MVCRYGAREESAPDYLARVALGHLSKLQERFGLDLEAVLQATLPLVCQAPLPTAMFYTNEDRL
jgi:hypothetical protein